MSSRSSELDDVLSYIFDPFAVYIIRVLDALEHAHGREIVHHDIKPSNILVGNKGVVSVFDWGIARSISANAKPAGGTYAYMSPESWAKKPVEDCWKIRSNLNTDSVSI